MKQVLEAIAAETGASLSVLDGPRREGDPAKLVADVKLGRFELGFDPRLSDLTMIIHTAWNWHRRAHPKTGQLIDFPSRAANPQASVLGSSKVDDA